MTNVFTTTSYSFTAHTYPSWDCKTVTINFDCVSGNLTGFYSSGSSTKKLQILIGATQAFYSTDVSGNISIDSSAYSGEQVVSFCYSITSEDAAIVNLYLEDTRASPTSAFSGTPTSGNAPLTVTFTNTTTGCPLPTSAWSFGDSGNSSTTSPSHEYTTGGLYTVSLVSTNSQGDDTETKTDYITVYEPASSVEVSGDDEVLISVSKDYTVTPTGGYYSSLAYLWTVTGDGVIGEDYTLSNSTSETCSITFNSAKTFEVNCAVTAKDSGGSAIGDAVSDTLEVSAQNCIAAFSADTTAPQQFTTVTFTNASTGTDLTYLWEISGTEDTDWEFANGTTETDEDIEITFINDGNYDVSLQVYKSEVACDLETKSSYILVSPVVTAQSMRKSFCIVVNNTSYRNVR